MPIRSVRREGRPQDEGPLVVHNRAPSTPNAIQRGHTGTMPRFVPLADVAETLSISAAQAYSLVRSGELPAIQVGGRGQWRVELTQLEAYIERKYAETRRQVTGQEPASGPVPDPVSGQGPDSQG